MLDMSKYTVKAAKPLPLLLLLDTSGSMSGEKIRHMNQAIKEMIDDLKAAEQIETEIRVSVITFGPVQMQFPFTSVSQINWKDLEVTGDTPIGAVLKEAKQIIEDRNVLPQRCYKPTVILVSDGQPTDSWREAMNAFKTEGRSAKCNRMAMAIGGDADEQMLSSFIEGTENVLFHAEDATKIKDFFKFVTMTVTTQVKTIGQKNASAGGNFDI